MALALGCSLLASLLCFRAAAGPWRSRLHHLLPTALMAIGMGHAGLPHGLPTAVLAASGLWVLGVVLARRARRLRPELWADAVDAFAMASTLVVTALADAGTAAQAAAAPGPGVLTGHGHDGRVPVVGVGVGVGGGAAWPAVAVVVLVVVVVVARMSARRDGRRPAVVRSLPPAALMSVSLVAMLAG